MVGQSQGQHNRFLKIRIWIKKIVKCATERKTKQVYVFVCIFPAQVVQKEDKAIRLGISM